MRTNDLPICAWCDEPVLEGERLAPNYAQPTHYECGLRGVLGSVGHQRRRCSCFGGDEEDPPGMTRREAARAAAEYFHLGMPPAPIIHPPSNEPEQ